MPNHVTTRLSFHGPEHVVASMLAAIRTEHPARQGAGHGGWLRFKRGDDYAWQSPDGARHHMRADGRLVEGGGPLPEGWQPDIEPAWTQFIDFEKIIPQAPCVDKGDLSSTREEECPHRNWYAANSRRWGTKWNAYCTRMDDAGRLIFETAWAWPQPIIEELSWLFPEVEISMETISEGCCFWGTGKFKGGVAWGLSITDPGSGYDFNADALYVRLERELRGWDPIKDEEVASAG